MANVVAHHLENVTSRNAFWRCYVIERAGYKDFWISHWGPRGSRGWFKVSFDGALSHASAEEKRQEKRWERGYNEAGMASFTVDNSLYDKLLDGGPGKRTGSAYDQLAREFTRALGREFEDVPLDEIFAGLRDMLAELD